MRVIVVTPPAPVVSLADAKEHLRVDAGDEDVLIGSYIEAATAHLDGPDGWLDRAIGVQTLEASGNLFGWWGLTLPYPPIISIASVTYDDTAGAAQTLASDAYRLLGAALEPAYGSSWPVTLGSSEPVRIRYTAGYTTVPAAIRQAILLMVGDMWTNRSSAVAGDRAAAVTVPMSTTVDNLLAPFRVYA